LLAAIAASSNITIHKDSQERGALVLAYFGVKGAFAKSAYPGHL
jgi:hypothetical protein